MVYEKRTIYVEKSTIHGSVDLPFRPMDPISFEKIDLGCVLISAGQNEVVFGVGFCFRFVFRNSW